MTPEDCHNEYMKQRLQELEDAIRDFKARLYAEDREPEVDWSKMAGRLVMVKYGENEDWRGPFVYHHYRGGTNTFPHEVVAAPDGEFDAFMADAVKPYTGPTRPNWIEWRGDGDCPVGPEDLLLVQVRAGVVHAVRAGLQDWRHHQLSGDIMRYTIIEL